MRISNLEKAYNYEVEKWLISSIPELTYYQKEKIQENEIIRLAPFTFMKRAKKVENIMVRLSIVFIIPVLLLLIIGLPFNFIVTGSWGYDQKMIGWFGKWLRSCGL